MYRLLQRLMPPSNYWPCLCLQPSTFPLGFSLGWLTPPSPLPTTTPLYPLAFLVLTLQAITIPSSTLWLDWVLLFVLSSGWDVLFWFLAVQAQQRDNLAAMPCNLLPTTLYVALYQPSLGWLVLDLVALYTLPSCLSLVLNLTTPSSLLCN